jgi:hypothetical protein
MTCQDCKLEKDEIHFKKYTRKKCIDCYRVWQREYDAKNRDRVRERQRKYQKENRAKLNERRREYVKENKELVLKNLKDFKLNNPNYHTEYSRNRYNADLMFKFRRSCRNLIKLAFRNKKSNKTLKTEIILGCSFEEFKLYLESKFESWMTWDNRGIYNGELNYGWDIDHIVPVSSANTEEELIKLNHYSNLQPLCSKINRHIKKDILNFI